MTVLYSWLLGFVAGGLTGVVLAARVRSKRYEKLSAAMGELEESVSALLIGTGVVRDAKKVVNDYEKGRGE